MQKMVLIFLTTAALCIPGIMAQPKHLPGVSPLDKAFGDAGLFVLQLAINGDLEEFPTLESPIGQVDEGDPHYNLPADSEVSYPFSISFHFQQLDRSEIAPKIITLNPTCHARAYKESEDAPWILKEYWKITDGIRTDLPIPSIEAQLLANKSISPPVSYELPATNSSQPTQNNLKKITCPRCNGEAEHMAACLFCRKRGYIWVESTSDNK